MAGISEALVATAVGPCLVAIPLGPFFYNWCRQRQKKNIVGQNIDRLRRIVLALDPGQGRTR